LNIGLYIAITIVPTPIIRIRLDDRRQRLDRGVDLGEVRDLAEPAGGALRRAPPRGNLNLASLSGLRGAHRSMSLAPTRI
jgi:hypothetical protein